MSTIRTRLSFAWAVLRDPGRLMRYDVESGLGWRPVAYSPFTDEVFVRRSQFGYITGVEQWLPRERFLGLGRLLSELQGQG